MPRTTEDNVNNTFNPNVPSKRKMLFVRISSQVLDHIMLPRLLSLVKMASRMAALVWKALVLLMFLFNVCSVFSHSPTISFTRN